MSEPNSQTNGHAQVDQPIIQVSMDLDSYENGELEDAEELVGGNLTELTFGKLPPQKVMNALLWVTMRRTDPDITYEQVRKMKGHAWVITRPDPTSASGGNARPTSSPPSAPTIGSAPPNSAGSTGT
jgi:hypothetical protein